MLRHAGQIGRARLHVHSESERKDKVLSQKGESDSSHHDVKSLPLEPGPLGQLVGIELRGRVSQKFWFEDVAAESVWQKATLVDLHFFGGSLEVQRH